MAIIKCRECGKDVSSDAKTCPHCGKSQASGLGGNVILIAILIVVTIIFIGNISGPTTPKVNDPHSDARWACDIALKQQLNDPDSAQYGSVDSWYTATKKDGTILVQPDIRAKNAFGAYIKATWECVTKAEGGNIRVVSLRQIRP